MSEVLPERVEPDRLYCRVESESAQHAMRSLLSLAGSGKRKNALSARLYILQRATALIMAPLVIGHIAVMIYVENGLSASEIIAYTRQFFWTAFYGLFALVAIHAAIGLPMHEWAGLKGVMCAIAGGLLWGWAGLAQAVYSVTG